ncbi:MAG: hypothetical protein WDM92_00875 [Caulobacteraceae bacterium]
MLTALKDGSRLSQTELARWGQGGAADHGPAPGGAWSVTASSAASPTRKTAAAGLIALTDEARARLPAGRAILEAGNREAMRGLSDERWRL